MAGTRSMGKLGAQVGCDGCVALDVREKLHEGKQKAAQTIP